MPKFCDSISYDILSQTPHHFETSLLIGSVWLTSDFTLLEALAVDAKKYSLKGENVKKCIRLGITALKIVIWGSKLLVLWSQIVFYGFAGALPLKKQFPTINQRFTFQNENF